MKKAQIFDVGMVFLVIGAMIAVLLVINTVSSQITNWKTIGQRAFELQNAYTEADYTVSFMSSSARWAAPKAIALLGSAGGFLQAPCGQSKNFAFWNQAGNPQTTCFPQAYENFYAKLGEEMKNYVTLYAKPKIIWFEGKQFEARVKPFDSPYEFTVINNKLLGIATAPLFVNILAPSEKLRPDIPLDWTGLWSTLRTTTFDPYFTGTYIYRPNFEISLNYNLGVYAALEGAVTEIVRDCLALPSDTEKKSCAKPKIEKALELTGDKQSTVGITNETGIYYFTISQDSRKTIYLAGNAPEIRFALAVPQQQAQTPSSTP